MNNQYLQDILQDEIQRQQDGLEMIPSENYASKDVLDAMGTVFNNKYAEGYPGRRYYGGQDNTDRIEQSAINLAKDIFRADHANVQPHSGAQANEAAYHAWLNPGETILAMDLSHGGHLTHGSPVTILAKQFNFVRYGMSDVTTGALDFNHIADLAKQHKPKIILAGYSAYSRELDYAAFAQIARDNDAVLMADVAHIAGLIAADVLKNPMDFGFNIMTTTTHKSLRGPRGGMILSKGTAGNPLQAPEKTVDNIPTLIDRTVFPGLQGGPHMNMIYAKAIALQEAKEPNFKAYAKNVIANAQELARLLMDAGFTLIGGGTDNHLMLIDMISSRGISGKEAEEALDKVGLTCNKNSIPDDQLPPFAPSGLRLGTPALTTRGLLPEDMRFVADVIIRAIAARSDDEALFKIKSEVVDYCSKFPLPGL